MPTLTVGTENGHPIDINYEDHGDGRPVVLLHGFPLAGDSWERQRRVLLEAGYRVIAHDRRGFGRSSRPRGGYDYDTFTDDLRQLLEALDVQDATLVGFSMGTGDVVRYLGNHGSARVRSAVCISMLPPFLVKSDDNPLGIDASAFDDIKAAIRADRYLYFDNLYKDFFRTDVTDPARYSDAVIRANTAVAWDASPHATLACIDSWLEDFRPDLPKIDVPLLILHGAIDVNTPIDATARRFPELVPTAELVEFPDGPHILPWTHAQQVNEHLLGFLAEGGAQH
jgi:non-heme chloroperoxidase